MKSAPCCSTVITRSLNRRLCQIEQPTVRIDTIRPNAGPACRFPSDPGVIPTTESPDGSAQRRLHGTHIGPTGIPDSSPPDTRNSPTVFDSRPPNPSISPADIALKTVRPEKSCTPPFTAPVAIRPANSMNSLPPSACRRFELSSLPRGHRRAGPVSRSAYALQGHRVELSHASQTHAGHRDDLCCFVNSVPSIVRNE